MGVHINHLGSVPSTPLNPNAPTTGASNDRPPPQHDGPDTTEAEEAARLEGAEPRAAPAKRAKPREAVEDS